MNTKQWNSFLERQLINEEHKTAQKGCIRIIEYTSNDGILWEKSIDVVLTHL